MSEKLINHVRELANISNLPYKKYLSLLLERNKESDNLILTEEARIFIEKEFEKAQREELEKEIEDNILFYLSILYLMEKYKNKSWYSKKSFDNNCHENYFFIGTQINKVDLCLKIPIYFFQEVNRKNFECLERSPQKESDSNKIKKMIKYKLNLT